MSATPCLTTIGGSNLFALSGTAGGGGTVGPTLSLSTLNLDQNVGNINWGDPYIRLAETGQIALNPSVSISTLTISTINGGPFEPGGIYPLVSTLNVDPTSPFASGTSTFTSTFTGSHSVVVFTDFFSTFQNHKYGLTWAYGGSNTGEPTPFATQVWKLNVSGGAAPTYAPPAGVSGYNTIDGADIQMTFEWLHTGPTTSQNLLLASQDIGNASTVSTVVRPPLSGGASFNICLTDYGPVM
jgi:hypothetical protein